MCRGSEQTSPEKQGPNETLLEGKWKPIQSEQAAQKGHPTRPQAS
jgi:hypothetical protein